jgi:DNA-binding beta-propeller fold protein YncE
MRLFPLPPALIVVPAAFCTLGACGGAPSPPVTAPVARALAPANCVRLADPSRGPKRLLVTRTGSTVALADVGGKTFAYVADEDDQALHVVDVDGQKDLGSTPLGGRPAQLMFLPDGRLVATLRDQARIVVLEPQPDPAKGLDLRCAVATDAEPYGLALSPDGGQLLVTSAWGRTLASYDPRVPTLRQTWDIALPREPRSVILSDDGTKAFVAQAVGGHVSVVDVTMQRVVPTETHPTEENVKSAAKAGTLGAPESTFRFTTFAGKGTSCQGFALAKTEDPVADQLRVVAAARWDSSTPRR